ncbi:MAG: hypothetical protein CVT60_04190 [Actinobacteria bacterium HGW-Actinobacteria-10]|nr:MAG: hypothetical protein CVT60_04190 [Actinobacteria bacterium HGW-Actinobacteria-10]
MSIDLDRFDSTAFVSGLAALQLRPESVEKTLRLEAAVAASLGAAPSRAGKDRVGLSSAHHVFLHDFTLEYLAAREDPLPGPVCQEILFEQQGRLVLPGQDPGGVLALELIVRTLFLHPSADSLAGIDRAKDVLRAGLALSHRMCGNAGLSPSSGFLSGAGEELCIPAESALHELSQAVVLDAAGLDALMLSGRFSEEGLGRLICEPGAIDLESFDPDDNELLRHPLLSVDGGVIIASPYALVPAMTHAAVSALEAQGSLPEFAKMFEHTVGMHLDQMLAPLGLKAASYLGSPPAGAHLFLCASDTDKAVLIACLTDARDDVSAVGSWSVQDRVDELLKIAEAKARTLKRKQGVRDVTLLVTLQRLCRNGVASLAWTPSPKGFDRVAMMSLEELRVLADSIGGRPRRLHYFLQDLQTLRQDNFVRTWSTLDLFRLWEDKGDGFYLGDDVARSGMGVVLDTSSGGDLRREVARKVGRHVCPGYESGTLLEVEHHFKELAVPIFQPSIAEHPALCLRSGPCSVWVVAPELAEGLPFPMEPQLIETLAYWLWRLAEPLGQAFDDVRLDLFVISLVLESPETWARVCMGQELVASGDLAKVVPQAPDRLEVRLFPGFALRSVDSSDAEIDLFAMILDGLGVMLGDDAAPHLHAAHESLAQWAKSSECRMMNTFRGDREIDPRGLAQPHEAPRSLQNRVLDGLGAEAAKKGWLAGSIDGERPVGMLLVQMVHSLYEQFALEVARYDEHLIPMLIHECEAQLFATRVDEQTRARAHSCFGDVEDMLTRDARKTSERASVAIASRFLVEYVTAIPPVGVRRASHGDIDDLLSRAVVLLDFAHEAELSKVGLGPTSAEMLASGRVGLSRQDHFFDAQALYLKDILRIQVAPENDEAGAPTVPTPAQMDAALRAELGLNMQLLLDVVDDLSELAWSASSGLGLLPEEELIERVARAGRVSVSAARRLVDRLALRPRDAFADPPEGLDRNDVLPWRVGRRYSYIVRPFICAESGGTTMVHWGPRHLFSSVRQTLFQVAQGRFRGQSEEMTSFQGRLKHLRGEQFSDQVARLLHALPNVDVIPRFKGWANCRLPHELGDIDVLAADHKAGILWAIECKSFEMTIVPADLQNDIRDIEKAIGKQLKRAEWLQANPYATQVCLKLHNSEYEVRPLIVLAALQLPVYLSRPDVPVVHIDRLLDFIRQRGASVPPL